MRYSLGCLPISACLLMVLLLSSPAFAWNGKVIKMLSGDTFIVSGKKQPQTIKLYGLACPSVQTRLGKKAMTFTRAKIYKKTVKINPVGKDRQNRTLAQVSVNGQSLNAFIIRSGYGLVNRQQCTAPACDEWIRFERYAHKQKKGIWTELESFSQKKRPKQQK